VLAVHRLFEDIRIHDHDGVRRQNCVGPDRAVAFYRRIQFSLGQTLDVLLRRFVGLAVPFFYVDVQEQQR
jgi:hypothetical protein